MNNSRSLVRCRFRVLLVTSDVFVKSARRKPADRRQEVVAFILGQGVGTKIRHIEGLPRFCPVFDTVGLDVVTEQYVYF